MLHITPIPALKDNYIWLIVHLASNHCLLVDPGESTPVIETLLLQDWRPIAILLTHHHADHTAGALGLSQHYQIPVFGSAIAIADSPAITQPLRGGESLPFNALSLLLTVLAIPGHTHDHLAYYGENMLFCGDTLFTGGCGRLFEGTAAQMYHSLQRLAALPDNTLIYCGHEYTRNNLIFAQTIEPDNPILQQRILYTAHLLNRGLPTVPSTMGLEKQTNPFLRCHEPSITHKITDLTGKRPGDPIEAFAALRDLKNSFKIN